MGFGQRLRTVLSGGRAPLTSAGPRDTRVGLPAAAVEGVDPSGRPAALSLEEGRAGLLFLTGSCAPCRILWDEATAGPVAIVTPSPSTEGRRRVAQLVPPGVGVVMSSEAWIAYGVTLAPWLVIVEDGMVVAEGPAPRTWDAIDV